MKWTAIIFAVAVSGSAAAQESPVGKWRTYDDADGLAASIVRIEERNGVLEGYVVKILPRPGKDVDAICTKCEGNDKNQPVTGLKILWDMKRDPDGYSGGRILDPESGNVYRCKMEIAQGKLKVRGFIGVPWVGRTQVWTREQ